MGVLKYLFLELKHFMGQNEDIMMMMKMTMMIIIIGALAVLILRCSFGLTNWKTEQIKKLTGKLERC